ncbi:unnamed protein product [Paramecium primaurelia]|uniref:Uncharacterized protein n=1 Tax=Paramecium primaurelia TaxID=5886 RepID=A0A8S1QPU5_PARPR|nr:unnamed protein product [Paramecium primaurelia]
MFNTISYFQQQLQITFDGQYKNTKKDGKWDVFYKFPQQQKLQKIGGGLYGNGVKIGKWIEIDEKSVLDYIVSYNGEYHNDKKVGLWTTLKKKSGIEQLCGSANYDEDGTEIFKNDEASNFLQVGEFKNGKKVGKWNIFYKHYNNDKFQLIGGGSYDTECEGFKIGNWVELSDFNADNREIIYKGEYKYGKRVGQWDIVCIGAYNKPEKKIGGGQYDDNGIKIGLWIEDQQLNKYITNQGEYNQGKKVGKWNILMRNSDDQPQQIGEGSYENGEKLGNWTECDECKDVINFSFYSQLTLDGFGFQICQGGYQIHRGEYKMGKKVGLWKNFIEQHKNFQLCGSANYDDDGTEIFKNDEASKILQVGEFKHGKKVGRWDIFYWDQKKAKFEQIGGGLYDEQGSGNKIGNWIEYKTGYKNNSQITFNGEYNNGKKVGLWKTYKKRKNFKIQNQIFQLCGCSNYDENGIELYTSDKNLNIFYLGDFMNGKKIGRWDIYNRWNKKQDFYKIGGGSYYEGGNGNKHGKWIELSNQFGFYRNLIYCGEYKNGIKVGRWDIGYKGELEKVYKKIGGGTYANGMKIGKWIELNEQCQEITKSQYYQFHDAFEIYQGNYKFGKKFGLWETFKIQNQIINFNILSGSANYDEDGTEIFKNDEASNFLQVGEFKKGKKVGKWNIFFKHYNNDKFQLIGGGSYDTECEGFKIGNWIELSDEGQKSTNSTKYQICQGDYKFYKKIGLWKKFNIIYKNLQLCGSANYDEDGTEIFQNDETSQILYIGEFRNRKKVGRWDILYGRSTEEFIKIGGGQYDENGNFKIGQWIDLIDSFGYNREVIYKGEYYCGEKVGKWNILYVGVVGKEHNIIGGGQYDNSIKIGKWTDLSDSFTSNNAIMYKGEYKNGNKVGLWDILLDWMYFDKLKIIGGGFYDKQGYSIKIGQWMELSEQFTKFCQIMTIGEYKNGRKVGTWNEIYIQ